MNVYRPNFALADCQPACHMTVVTLPPYVCLSALPPEYLKNCMLLTYGSGLVFAEYAICHALPVLWIMTSDFHIKWIYSTETTSRKFPTYLPWGTKLCDFMVVYNGSKLRTGGAVCYPRLPRLLTKISHCLSVKAKPVIIRCYRRHSQVNTYSVEKIITSSRQNVTYSMACRQTRLTHWSITK